jgi:hypothetical protein
MIRRSLLQRYYCVTNMSYLLKSQFIGLHLLLFAFAFAFAFAFYNTVIKHYITQRIKKKNNMN